MTAKQIEKIWGEKLFNIFKDYFDDEGWLTEKWIEAMRTTSNKVIITDGKTPIILGQ